MGHMHSSEKASLGMIGLVDLFVARSSIRTAFLQTTETHVDGAPGTHTVKGGGLYNLAIGTHAAAKWTVFKSWQIMRNHG